MKITLTLVAAISAAALLYEFVRREAKAEAGHVVGLVTIGGITTWFVWITAAVLWLIWR